MSRPSVVIADDHAPTREDIVFALDRGGFTVCAAVADAADAVAAVVRHRPDACLLDVGMPGGGIRAVWEIHARLPTCAIVVLTVSDDGRHLLGALHAGASGYLLKDIGPVALSRVLHRVLAGEVAIPRALVGHVVDQIRDRQAHRRSLLAEEEGSQLTSREWQVLALLRQGLATGEIADRLVVSPVTIRTHVKAIVRKLGFESRADLLRAFGPR